MKAEDFLQTGDDLIHAALAHAEALASRGYKLIIEPYELDYPYTPTLRAKRNQETMFIEVQNVLKIDVLQQWCRYGKACTKDTRVCVALTEKASEKVSTNLERLKRLGVGVLLIGKEGSYEALPAKDQALNAELPELPTKLRPLLGDAYDKFERGAWRDGFDDACTVLEQEARSYLKTHIGLGRIVTYDTRGKTPKKLTPAQAQRLTLGQLASAFEEIQTPNRADSRIGQALKAVNADRITVAHFKLGNAAREARLRKNVGKHMFRVLAGLREIRGLA